MEHFLKQGAKEMGIDLTDESIALFEKFTKMMLSYNEMVNLTAITEQKEIVIKHYLDSLTLFKTGLIKGGQKIIDVGCGGGFPSYPLIFADNTLKITMLDSLRKRVDFLKLVKDELKIENASSIHGRAEDFGQDKNYRENFDIAVSRAVARLSVLCEYCLPYVKPSGHFIAMKGSSFEQELNDAKNAIKILGAELIDVKKCDLPFSDISHYLIIIKKVKNISTQYPRKAGKITKEPL